MLQLLLRAAVPRRLIQPTNCLRSLATEAPTRSAISTSTAQPRPPYLVSRTPSRNLPVYHLAKRGGNYKLTVVKKIDGDKQALRRDLAQELGVDVGLVKVKVPTGHVEVKGGHYAGQITAWLEKQGF